MSSYGSKYSEIVSVSIVPYQPRPRFPGWKSYALMFCLLGIGVGTAVEHFFYHYLDGKAVDNLSISQTWVIRVGTACEFLFKSVLVASVGTAFAQEFWFIIRRKALDINCIDKVFSVLRNPLSFFSTSFISKTPLLFVTAIVCWYIPISAIFSPGALTGTTKRIRKLIEVMSSVETSVVPINITTFEFGDVTLFNQGPRSYERKNHCPPFGVTIIV